MPMPGVERLHDRLGHREVDVVADAGAHGLVVARARPPTAPARRRPRRPGTSGGSSGCGTSGRPERDSTLLSAQVHGSGWPASRAAARSGRSRSARATTRRGLAARAARSRRRRTACCAGREQHEVGVGQQHRPDPPCSGRRRRALVRVATAKVRLTPPSTTPRRRSGEPPRRFGAQTSAPRSASSRPTPCSRPSARSSTRSAVERQRVRLGRSRVLLPGRVRPSLPRGTANT